MAIPIPDMGRITEKWKENAGRAGSAYQYGVLNPKRAWEPAAREAEKAYEAGVQAAIARKAWGKGLSGKGEKWGRNAAGKGVSNYPTGVAAAGEDYDKGFGPYRGVIAGLTLPPRGPAGDPANLRRVEIVAKALHDKKVKG